MNKSICIKLTVIFLIAAVISQLSAICAFASEACENDGEYFRDILEEADKTVGWFLSSNPFEYEFDTDDSVTLDYEFDTVEGKKAPRKAVYYRVINGFESFEEFYGHVHKYLPDELVNNLFYAYLDTGTVVFTEHNGALYFNEARASTRVYNINKDTESYDLIERDDKSAVLRYYPTQDQSSYYDYNFRLKSDGEYEITNFIPTSSMYYGNSERFVSLYYNENPRTSDTSVVAIAALACIALAGVVVASKRVR
ncbi:MAG: hypothetical protein J5879_08380 [Clostridia bacterium]|nr:hypothetical protein [Clostridia bacterium]